MLSGGKEESQDYLDVRGSYIQTVLVQTALEVRLLLIHQRLKIDASWAVG